jgi:hypothetical protein
VANTFFPNYQGFSGASTRTNAISNYNSLQASITKRMSSGLSLSFNYVWWHILDELDSSGWGSRAGPQAIRTPTISANSISLVTTVGRNLQLMLRLSF